MSNDLAGRAESLGLHILAGQLARAGAAGAAPADPSLSAPRASDPFAAIDQMQRRGLDPSLVEIALGAFDAPLERGLFAWDALVSGLYAKDQSALVERLREAARAVDDVLPLPGSAFADLGRCTSVALVERLAVPAYASRPLEALEEPAGRRALGALFELERRNPGALRLTPIPERTRQFAATLARSHLSTLASFYLDWLWRAIPLQAALLDLVEVLLDAGASQSLPAEREFLAGADAERLELYGYAQARLALSRWEHAQVLAALSGAGPASPRTRVIVADAAVEEGQQPVPIGALDEVCAQHPAWRYAHRVRVSVLARFEPDGDRVLRAVDDFVARFGNDFHLTQRLVRYAPPNASWLAGVRARALRDAAALPHDWASWAALALVLLPEGADRAVDEIDERLRAQSTL